MKNLSIMLIIGHPRWEVTMVEGFVPVAIKAAEAGAGKKIVEGAVLVGKTVHAIKDGIVDIKGICREVNDCLPKCLKDKDESVKGDINKPLVVDSMDGLTDYQRNVLSKEYGWSDEQINRVGSWEEVEKILEEIEGFDEDLIKSKVEGQETKQKNNSVSEIGKTDLARTPSSNGEWSGERGNSTWHPDGEYIPPEKSPENRKPYSNPENKTWNEILEKYGIDGIPFRDGFPDFSEVSRGTVEIEGFETGGSDAKNRNFAKADIELAKQKGCSPEDVEKWRKENNYTWHECEDKKTMQKVPNEIHANIPHDGGRSQE